MKISSRGLLTSKEAAEYIGSTEGSLRSSRSTGHGPKFNKIGAAVMYRSEDLEEYLANLKPYIVSRKRNRALRAEERGAPG